MINTYLQYGISDELASKLVSANISKTAFLRMSKKNLIEIYGLTEHEITMVKNAIKRKPIDSNIVSGLLESSNYTCCICKGIKGTSYIIHHIEEYSINQDNRYDNLAVLCPNCHDLAHKKGNSLSLTLKPKQIKSTKQKWEREVLERNKKKASRSGDIAEIDFLNVQRIVELYDGLFHKTPITKYSITLISKGLIKENGLIDDIGIKSVNQNPITPFIFFGLDGSMMLRFHYYQIFEEILNYLDFVDLKTLLNQDSVRRGLIGTYCHFTGGLYSSALPSPILNDSEMMKFHFKKKQFQVNFLVDPKYFCSKSAKYRTYDRGTYKIFGKIRNVNVTEDRKAIILDIRPYCFGTPHTGNDRNPCLDDFDDIFGPNWSVSCGARNM